MSKIVKGIEASPGIAIGKIFLYQENELVIDEKRNVILIVKKRDY